MRFMVRPADGATAIIDTAWSDRLVARCPQLDEAMAIMAFLNGDHVNAEKMHHAFLSRLSSLP